MDPASDPGRDDYGLPPVDVDIPDDASELDRDVLAYRRELRSRRRRSWLRRAAAPFTQHGMVIPLIAACLALSLLAGSLLTALTGRQPARDQAQITASSLPSPRPQADEGPLNAQVLVDGQSVQLRALTLPALLAWVPASCGCGAQLRRLARQVASARVRLYFVATHQAIGQVTALARQHFGQAVEDTGNVLGRTYRLRGLAAILAARGGVVTSQDVLRTLPSGPLLQARLRSLAPAGQPGPLPQAS